MTYTYLLLATILFLLSLFLFFNKALKSGKGWKVALPAALISSILCSSITGLLVGFQVIIYDTRYITGFFIGNLPFEERIFCLVMPFAGLGIYSSLNLKFPDNNPDRFSLTVSNLLIGLCIAMVFFGYKIGNIYSISIYVALAVQLISIEYIGKLRFMYRFYRFWVIFTLLCWPVYFIVTGLSHIPAYFMAVLLPAVYLFELFRSKSLSKIEAE